MELSQTEKNEIKSMLEESKKSRNTWGTIGLITLALFFIEVFTKTIVKGEIGITIGGFTLMASGLMLWRWWKKREKVSKYERLLSKVAE